MGKYAAMLGFATMAMACIAPCADAPRQSASPRPRGPHKAPKAVRRKRKAVKKARRANRRRG